MRRNSLANQTISLLVSLTIAAAGIVALRAMMYKPSAEASAKTPPPIPIVHTAVLRSHAGSLDIAADGVVVPYREIEVAAEVSGKVVFKDEACNGGRFVTRGRRLIKIDPRDYLLAVQRLENQLEQAQADLEELQVEIGNTEALIELAEDQVQLEQNEVNRLAGLIQERIVTDSALDRAKQVELNARNGLVQLKNQLNLLTTRQRRLEIARDLVLTDLEKAKLDLNRTEIEAAVDGVVIEDFVERDSFVQKGESVFRIEDTSAVEVKCRLKMDELYWIWRQTGQEFNGFESERAGYQIPRIPVTIQYQLSDRKGIYYQWPGVLVRFDGIGLDEATRTVACRVLVEKPRDVRVVSRRQGEPGETSAPGGVPALVRGMFVTVTFHVDQPSPLLLIPERAVQPGKRLWIVDDGHLVEKRAVDLIELIQVPSGGGELQSYWLVEASAAGLAAGDRVVVPPFGVLRNNDPVREEPVGESLAGESPWREDVRR